ncbi:MAG: 6-phosphofructokinase [Acidobacteriaceae bacterium]|nr:6-phosphofructokinase [Acidobacteriaceae bacterium]MBV9781462.1 6-phosphofructokinase [Acidobacteriaceae bacterium]
MAGKKIGILTGGGDVPGLNAVIKNVVYRSTSDGHEVTGIRLGWRGLTHLNCDDPESVKHYVLPLNRENTRTIDRSGGTFLHTSRTNPSKMKDVPDFLNKDNFPSAQSTKNGATSTTYDLSKQVLSNLERLEIEYLIAIGGDDTLSYAATLDRLGFNVIGIPKTMDNDVRNTEYCIGFSTAISRAKDSIQRQRTTVGSHERVGIFRVFGRDAGYTALYTAYVTSIRCGIPEYEFDLDHMIDLLMTDKENNPSNYCLVILSEGAKWKGYEVKEYGAPDAFGHRHKFSVAEAFSDEIINQGLAETVVSDLTYDLRSGVPDFLDTMIATTFGTMAYDAFTSQRHGLMAAVSEGKFAMVSIPDPKLGPRKLDVEAMYNKERYRPSYANKEKLPLLMTHA